MVLPQRETVLIRGAYVMTLEAELGDVAGGDVLIRDGAIAAVGRGLEAPGAAVIEAGGMIALPGFVDTHWHMWNTLLRCMSGDRPEHGYFKTSVGLGQVFEAEDVYQGTRLACAEAIHSGITTVHDWSHNVRGPGCALAGLRALQESGLRGRFSYGYRQAHPNEEAMDLEHLEQLAGEWERHAPGGLLRLGMAWRGTAGSNPTIRVPAKVYMAEIEAARRLGLPISVHASGPPWAAGQIRAIAEAGLLGPDMQVVHGNAATEDEIRALAEAGAAVSVSPFTELHIGYGMPRTSEFLAAGIPTGLSVDTTVLAGNADMSGIMKVTQAVENGKAQNEFHLTARRTLELATVDSARSLGLGEVVGTLRPGKRADVILISPHGPNLGVFAEPAHMVVSAAQPANIDTVVVDGRVLKRHGRLTRRDADAVGWEADRALARVRERAGWW